MKSRCFASSTLCHIDRRYHTNLPDPCPIPQMEAVVAEKVQGPAEAVAEEKEEFRSCLASRLRSTLRGWRTDHSCSTSSGTPDPKKSKSVR